MNKEEYIDAINNYWLGECGGENVGWVIRRSLILIRSLIKTALLAKN